MAGPRDQRPEPGPELAAPTIVLNHYQKLLNCFAAVLLHSPVRPMPVRFVAVPIDLERKMKRLVPMLVHCVLLLPALLQVVFLDSPMDWIAAADRSLVCPTLAAVAVGPGSERPTRSAGVLAFAPPSPVVVPG